MKKNSLRRRWLEVLSKLDEVVGFKMGAINLCWWLRALQLLLANIEGTAGSSSFSATRPPVMSTQWVTCPVVFEIQMTLADRPVLSPAERLESYREPQRWGSDQICARRSVCIPPLRRPKFDLYKTVHPPISNVARSSALVFIDVVHCFRSNGERLSNGENLLRDSHPPMCSPT